MAGGLEALLVIGVLGAVAIGVYYSNIACPFGVSCKTAGETPLVNTQKGNELGIHVTASGSGHAGAGNVAYAYPAHMSIA